MHRQKKYLRTHLDEVGLTFCSKNGDSPKLPLQGRTRVHWRSATEARATAIGGAQGHIADTRAGVEHTRAGQIGRFKDTVRQQNYFSTLSRPTVINTGGMRNRCLF